ncbi:hypothetical protein DMH04_49610 [Kibdelosporangium aridum]|uniref:Nucleoside phosphorylase domain-containing protein n=1 Tax=Kibdelosporangium aridum TaxID=2030 RepID=A0A428YCA5_KIBAR|nr:hypothetical protein [Kibdelosporangium aridum]RSM65235.1 hypothetical protein DMH04_49610 [Kibdelosporangium aridum]
MAQPVSDWHVPFAQCRAIARGVRRAQHAKAAINTVRPRGVAGFIRNRAPLALVLYLAATEGRLVVQGTTAVAMLEPRAVGEKTWQPKGLRLGSLSFVDRRWSVLLFAAPAFILLGLSLLAFAVDASGTSTLVGVALALGYVLVVYLGMLVYPLFARSPKTQEDLGWSDAAARQWTMPLFHQENENRIDELFDQVRTRLTRLIAIETERHAQDRDARVTYQGTTAEVLCPLSGMTTDQARLRLNRLSGAYNPFKDGHNIAIRVSSSVPGRGKRIPIKPISFFRLFAVAVIAAVMGNALLVNDFERDFCAVHTCTGGLVEYGQALLWLLYQAIWQQPARLTPMTDVALTLGWLMRWLALAFVLVAVTAAVRLRAARIEAIKSRQEAWQLMGSTRLLIVTVADVERDAMLDEIEELKQEKLSPRFDGPVPVWSAGSINDTEIFVVQAGMQGEANYAGSIHVTARAIRHVAPDYAIITGICYGLDAATQPGHVLVASEIMDLNHGKLHDVLGETFELPRGPRVPVSHLLLEASRALSRGWTRTAIHIGLMLSWNKLVNSQLTVEQLINDYPDAIGGDMEGHGFQATTIGTRVDSILIKAVSDKGVHKNDRDQVRAARNAAAFVLHLVGSGALSRTPEEQRAQS